MRENRTPVFPSPSFHAPITAAKTNPDPNQYLAKAGAALSFAAGRPTWNCSTCAAYRPESLLCLSAEAF